LGRYLSTIKPRLGLGNGIPRLIKPNLEFSLFKEAPARIPPSSALNA